MMNNNLWQQLEIVDDFYAAVVNPPGDYFEILGGTLLQKKMLKGLNSGRFDLIHVFITMEKKVKDHIMEALFSLTPWGIIWVSWPKEQTDLTPEINGDDIRKAAQSLGLRDEKIIDFDDNWWAIKLTIGSN